MLEEGEEVRKRFI